MSLIDEYLNQNRSGGPDRSSRPRPSAADVTSPSTQTLDTPVAMLDFVLSDGSRAAYPYAILLRTRYEPEAGIVLEYSNDTIVVRGYALDDLYKAVIQHRASRIEINGDPRGFGQPDGPQGPVVTAIEILETK